MKGKILIVDDEKLICWSLQKDLTQEGYEIVTAMSAQETLTQFDREMPDVVLLDIRLPDGDGIDILQDIRKKNPMTGVIMITANDDVRMAVQCMRLGAFTYLQKPVNFDELRLNIEKAFEGVRLRKKVTEWEQHKRGKYDFQSVVAESRPMKSVLELVRQIIQSETSTVLLEGESGTGKDLIARILHYQSQRGGKEFTSINCAALPETLLESELFGHEKGAFTDARQMKKGLVVEAQGGTLFLDEIGDMQKGLQAKLLHLIDQKRFRKVGGVKECEADIRIIAATNKDLKKEVGAGRFREDLYYRLNVIRILLPPLREHKEDIPPLVGFFVAQFNQQFKASVSSVSSEAMDTLTQYHWPGNIRELKNVIERAMILYKGNEIRRDHFPSELDCNCILKDSCDKSVGAKIPTRLPNCLIDVPLTDIEKQLIIQTLEAAEGNQSKAARMLGIGRDALRYKIQKFGLDESLTKSEMSEIPQNEKSTA